jgi:hypothetical protein
MESMTAERVDISNVPAHVPPELIVPHDIWATTCVHARA